MTATPIPRTLALTVYGDLAVSEIAKPPATPQPIVTAWVAGARVGRVRAAARAPRRGAQAYVVCPLIEESETSSAGAAEAEAERLRRAELRGLPRRPSARAAAAGRAARADGAFKESELDVLVATTVIEVGVDVPNATIMIVQDADRFGLAQLHQLRGRVGRGAEQSYCLLVSRPREDLTEPALARLQALVATRTTASSSRNSTSTCGARAISSEPVSRSHRPPLHAPPGPTVTCSSRPAASPARGSSGQRRPLARRSGPRGLASPRAALPPGQA